MTKQGHRSTPKYYRPNAVVDIISHGTQHDRIIYDENGCFMTLIHGGDHGQPKYHQYGYHGEHAHDLVFDADTGKLIEKSDRELTAIERIQHADIIWGEKR